MRQRKSKKRLPGDRGAFTTAAGLARSVGKHRGTVTRALRRLPGGVRTRIGHQFMLGKRTQAQLRKLLR